MQIKGKVELGGFMALAEHGWKPLLSSVQGIDLMDDNQVSYV